MYIYICIFIYMIVYVYICSHDLGVFLDQVQMDWNP